MAKVMVADASDEDEEKQLEKIMDFAAGCGDKEIPALAAITIFTHTIKECIERLDDVEDINEKCGAKPLNVIFFTMMASFIMTVTALARPDLVPQIEEFMGDGMKTEDDEEKRKA